jgi:hypothetical protein
MAVSKNNPLTHGASGMIGGTVVFRSWNGKTFMYNRPKKPTSESVAQKENRSKFKMATHFAKRMMKDPAKKEEYKEIAKKLSLPNAYTAAITEYMRKPHISNIDLEGYSGNKDEEIVVEASKKGFDIESVEVIVVDADGQVIEQGKGLKGEAGQWAYKTSKKVTDLVVGRIIVKARDRTGNFVDKKISIPRNNQV